MRGLTEHLRNGQQCDEEGIMCIVSRQACHEAADHIEKLEEREEHLRELLSEWRNKISGPGMDMRALLHLTDQALEKQNDTD